MIIGVCKIELRLEWNHSLKGKRQVFRSISTRVHSKFNVSVAEIENNDRHTLLTLGVSCVSNNSRHANEVLSKVVDYIQTLRPDAEFLDYQIDIITGV